MLYQHLWYNINMEQISATEFKANCLAVVQRVQKTGKPIEITRYGKPVAEIVPSRPKAGKKSWIGSMAGTGEILGDIITPAIPESDWDMLKPARRNK
jgi:prevent-host-death family protein